MVRGDMEFLRNIAETCRRYAAISSAMESSPPGMVCWGAGGAAGEDPSSSSQDTSSLCGGGDALHHALHLLVLLLQLVQPAADVDYSSAGSTYPPSRIWGPQCCKKFDISNDLPKKDKHMMLTG